MIGENNIHRSRKFQFKDLSIDEMVLDLLCLDEVETMLRFCNQVRHKRMCLAIETRLNIKHLVTQNI